MAIEIVSHQIAIIDGNFIARQIQRRGLARCVGGGLVEGFRKLLLLRGRQRIFNVLQRGDDRLPVVRHAFGDGRLVRMKLAMQRAAIEDRYSKGAREAGKRTRQEMRQRTAAQTAIGREQEGRKVRRACRTEL